MLTRKATLLALAVTAAILPMTAVRPLARAQANPVPAVPTSPASQGDVQAHLSQLKQDENSRFGSAPGRADYYRQMFWFIRHQPDSQVFQSEGLFIPAADTNKRDFQPSDAVLYAQGKALWLQQVSEHPQNTVIMSNAAECFTLSDKPLAAQFLLQAEKVAPDDGLLYQQLGQLYQLEIGRASLQARREWAQKAVAQFQTAQTLDTEGRYDVLADLAKAAYTAGEYAHASRYATQLLQRGKAGNDWNSGNDIHQANLVLGRLALRNGDTAQAEADLLAMGNVPGSPQLDSFGPNMQLAQDLLTRGDRQPVLTYFQECAKFWKGDNGLLKAWTEQVQQGKMPDFSANLYY